MIQVLNLIDQHMTELGINYEFIEWTGGLTYPYFVGEYDETPAESEDGLSETVFMITGTTRGPWLELETAKAAIEAKYRDYRAITANGSGIAIYYDGSSPVPTGELELKRIQINLKIKEWKV